MIGRSNIVDFSSIFPKRARSWPMFWIFGTITGLLFVIMGPALIIGNLESDYGEAGAIFAGLFITLLGIGLLIAVIYTKILLSDDDLSLRIDLSSDRKRKKYNPERVVKYLSNQHNNVAIIKTDSGIVRMFSAAKVFVVEISFLTETDNSTFHMIDPEFVDITPVVMQNIVLEKIPVRKNRLMKKESAQEFLSKLYEVKDIRLAMEGFSFTDTSAETKRLLEKDAYIVPAIPLDFPNKPAERETWMKRKEEKLKRALEVLKDCENQLLLMPIEKQNINPPA